MINLDNIHLLAAYNCNAYGAGNYGECATTGTGTGTGTSDGGLLANTGYDILLPLALALSIIIAAAILLAKTLIRRRQSNNSK